MIMPVSFRQLVPARGCVIPALSCALERLDDALRREDWAEANRQQREGLRHLLLFFTSAAAGLVQELEKSRPEIQALAQSVDSLASFERLLRFSLSVLRTLEHPSKDIMLNIFFPKETGQPHPLQGRWLMVEGPSSDTPPLLSACDDELAPLATGAAPPSSALPEDRLEAYLPILINWLQDGHEFLAQFHLDTEETDQGRTISGLASSDFSFCLLPKIEWLAPSEAPAAPLALPLDLDSRPATQSREANRLGPPLGAPRPHFTEPPNTELPETIPHPAASSGFHRSVWSPADLDPKWFEPLHRESCPSEITSRIHAFCQSQRSGYILLEGPAGAGKTLVVNSLAVCNDDEVAYSAVNFPVRQALQFDFQTFIEIFDEGLKDGWGEGGRSSEGHAGPALRPLGHRVTRELNIRYPAQYCSERFFAYLSGLLLLNGTRLLIVLDGLDEVFEGSESQVFLSDFLPETVPDGTFILVTCQRDACASRAIRKLQTLERFGALRLRLDPAAMDYRRLCQSFLGEELPAGSQGQPLSLMGHRQVLANSGLLNASLVRTSAELLPLAFEALERQKGFEPIELGLALASVADGLSLTEMTPLGLPGSALQSILEGWPSLVRFSSGGQVLRLAHEELRQFLQENYAQAYSACCRRLAHRASYFLTQEADLQPSKPDFELQRRMLSRLHAWLLDSQDVELIRQVFFHPSLKQLRQALCNQLEAEGRFHHKLSILAGYRECLTLLTARYPQDELHEELAWAHNSRGLTYYRLGQFARSLTEIEQAIHIFTHLIHERGCEAYRSGLASALNRQSEALLHLDQIKAALASADRSVEAFRTVIEQGKSELKHFLARSLAHRARCYVALGGNPGGDKIPAEDPEGSRAAIDEAVRDYGEALAIHESLAREANPRQLHAHAETLVGRAEQHLFQGLLSDAREDLESATEQIDKLRSSPSHLGGSRNTDLDWRLLALRALEVGAQVNRTEGLYHAAIRHCDDALDILQNLLDAGRLDLRDQTARLLLLRGQLWAAVGDQGKSATDWTHALAYMSRLIEFEGHPGLRRQRSQIYLLRARYLQNEGRAVEAIQDYERAIEDLSGLSSPPARPERLDLRTLFELSQAHLCLGLLLQEMGEEKQATDRFTSAIRHLQQEPSLVAHLCQAYRQRAQSQRRLGDLDSALSDAHLAVEKLAQAFESRPELRTDLALAHHQRGELHELQGDKELALKDFTLGIHLLTQEVSEPDPIFVRIFLARAQVYLELEQPQSALHDVEEALHLMPPGHGGSDRSSILLTAYSLKSRGHLALRQAQAALECQDQALILLASQTTADPGKTGYWLRRDRCMTLAGLGHLLEAADQFIQMIEPMGKKKTVGTSEHALFGDLCKQLRSQADRLMRAPSTERPAPRLKALDLLEKELQLRFLIGPNGEGLVAIVETLNLYGWLLSELDRGIEALQAFEQACSLSQEGAADLLNPTQRDAIRAHRVWTFKQRGLLLETMNQTESALVLYDEALDWLERSDARPESDARDDFAWILLRQAVLFAQQHRPNEAHAALCRSIEIDRALMAAGHQAAGPRLAQSLLLRARRGSSEEGPAESRDNEGSEAQILADLREALPILSEQEADGQAMDSDLLYCQWRLLTSSPTLDVLRASLAKLESKGVETALWPSGPSPMRQLPIVLQAVASLGPAAKPELARCLALVNQVPPDKLEDFPISPELFLRLLPVGGPHHELDLLALACRQSLLETRAYGAPGYPRLVSCLNQLGLRLGASAAYVDPSRLYWAQVRQAFLLLLQHVENGEGNPTWAVELNNMAKTWQSLPNSLLHELGITRSWLQTLRRW